MGIAAAIAKAVRIRNKSGLEFEFHSEDRILLKRSHIAAYLPNHGKYAAMGDVLNVLQRIRLSHLDTPI